MFLIIFFAIFQNIKKDSKTTSWNGIAQNEEIHTNSFVYYILCVGKIFVCICYIYTTLNQRIMKNTTITKILFSIHRHNKYYMYNCTNIYFLFVLLEQRQKKYNKNAFDIFLFAFSYVKKIVCDAVFPVLKFLLSFPTKNN